MATTKAKAIHDFFNGVLTAYPSTAVPDDAAMPYMTYTFSEASFGDEPQALTVNIYERTDSEASINALARKLSDAIGVAGASSHATTEQSGSSAVRRGAKQSSTKTIGASNAVTSTSRLSS